MNLIYQYTTQYNTEVTPRDWFYRQLINRDVLGKTVYRFAKNYPIKTAPEIENLAKAVDNSGGVYFVPAFNGSLAPWWNDDARGVLVGITSFKNRSQIAPGVLESICFQGKDVLG